MMTNKDDGSSGIERRLTCMRADTFSIRSHHSSKSAVEKAAQAIFTACGFFAVLAVASITLYMVISGTPALFKAVSYTHLDVYKRQAHAD